MNSDLFSPAIKELISTANFIAKDFGAANTSSIHFLLADCEIDDENSIRKFVFKSRDEYESFYRLQRENSEIDLRFEKLSLNSDSTLLLQKAFQNFSLYIDDQVKPYHLFLAAIKTKECAAFSLLNSNGNSLSSLENYYINLGLIRKQDIKKPAFNWLRNYFKPK